MSDPIEKARETALGILKPGKKELDRGLALHRESIVCEPYGFAPRASPDADLLQAAVDEGRSGIELADLRFEGRMTRCVTDPEERAEFREAFERAGVTAILQVAGEEGNSIPRMVAWLSRFTYVTDMLRDFVFKGTTPEDIVRAKKEGRHCLFLSCNGVPLPGRFETVEEELRFIRIFFGLGVRMMHLTYNRRNAIGDGCMEASDAGLSDFGRAVVAEMNRTGVLVDVAHSGRQTCLDAAKVSSRPVVASHTGCAALSDHPRCKPDEVIRAVADTGGLTGICCIPGFLGGSGDIRAMLDHICHAVKQVGADHVAIAPDLAHESRHAERHYGRIPKTRGGRRGRRWESFWPEGRGGHPGKPTPEQRLSMAWTNWPLFTVGLVQRGLGDEEIRKIIGGNVLRVLREVFPGTATD